MSDALMKRLLAVALRQREQIDSLQKANRNHFPMMRGLQRRVAELEAERDEAIRGNHRSNEYEPTWAELTGVWKARAETAEKKLQEMQAHIDHADAYHKAMLAAEADLKALRDAIAIKGGNEHSPTQDAYDAACVALQIHREWAEVAKADNARLLNDLKVISQFQATTSCNANIYSIWKMTERARAAVQPVTGDPVTLTYTNWRGETAQRTIVPQRVWFGSTDWHPEPQWLLTALDAEKGAERDFALKDFGNPAVQPDAAAIREAALREALEVCAAEVDQMRKIRRGANNANKMRRELEADGAFELLAVLAGMISIGKEVMPLDAGTTETQTQAYDIGPGDQAVAGAAPTIDELAQIIRTVDGDHSLGAGELAERILSALAQKGGE
jgi:hypothetical protein